MNHRTSIDDMLAAVDLAEVARAWVPDLKRRGHEHVGRCPFHSERTGSFTIYGRDGRDRFHCFGCGAKGDAIDFIVQVEDVSKGEAIRRLGGDTAPSPEALQRSAAMRFEQERRAAREKERRAKSALDTWRMSVNATGTIVETYLREARKIDVDALSDGIPPTLRFLPSHWHSETRSSAPAMIGAIQSADRRIVAAHITYLKADGSGKADLSPAKRMIGPAYGGAIRFGPVAERIGIAEGIETALSVAAVMPDLTIWAALSLQNMAGAGVGKGDRRDASDPRFEGKRNNRLPSSMPDMDRPGIILPAEVKTVLILGDGDGKDGPAGRALLDRAAARFRNEGRRPIVAVPGPGQDFNDLL